MKKILTHETEVALGELLTCMETGWTVNQGKVLDLLHSIKRDLRQGVNEETLSRCYGPVKVEEVVPSKKGLSDEEISKYRRYIKECRTSSRVFEREMGLAFEELLVRFLDITE